MNLFPVLIHVHLLYKHEKLEQTEEYAESLQKTVKLAQYQSKKLVIKYQCSHGKFTIAWDLIDDRTRAANFAIVQKNWN